MTSIRSSSAIVLAALVAAGCRREPVVRESVEEPARGMPRVDPPGSERHFQGRVRERMPAGSYTYLSVDTDAGPRWVVTLGEGVAPGTDVEVTSLGTRDRFWSRRLRRSFDRLFFAIVRERG
jgi:hypothetical protein